MQQHNNYFLVLPLLFLLHINPAYSVAVVPSDVIINETFDPAFGFGSYSVTNNLTGNFPDNLIFAFAVENPYLRNIGEEFEEGMVGWASDVFTVGGNEGPFANVDLSSFGVGSTFIGYFTVDFYLSSPDSNSGRPVPPTPPAFPPSIEFAIKPGETLDGFSFRATQANSKFIAFNSSTSNTALATGTTVIQTVPIPAAFWLFSSALAGLMAIRKR